MVASFFFFAGGTLSDAPAVARLVGFGGRTFAVTADLSPAAIRTPAPDLVNTISTAKTSLSHVLLWLPTIVVFDKELNESATSRIDHLNHSHEHGRRTTSIRDRLEVVRMIFLVLDLGSSGTYSSKNSIHHGTMLVQSFLVQGAATAAILPKLEFLTSSSLDGWFSSVWE